MQPLWPPVVEDAAAKLRLDRGAHDRQAESERLRLYRRRPASLDPFDDQCLVVDCPDETEVPVLRRKGAILGGVGGKLVQRQRHRLRGRRLQHGGRATGLDAPAVVGAIGREFLVDDLAEIGTLPARR
jgi:hypothetical protein